METIWRVVLVYLFLVFGLRVLGKREFGQLSALELVTLLIVPEIVSQALVRGDYSLTNALVGVSTLFSLVYFSSLLQHVSPSAQKLFSSSPTILVHDGHYIDKHMNQERVGPEEIFDAMHQSGLDRLEQVKWAILESDGKIAIVPKQAAQNGASSRTKAEAAVS